MVKDNQIKELYKLMKKDAMTTKMAAMKTGMDAKTARKYLRSGSLPSESKPERDWITRKDPFETIWPHVKNQLGINLGLEAKTLFEHYQRTYPGKFQDGQLRTFQRKVKEWRATEGPAKEVFFPQKHHPGRLSQSDFTDMSSLGITIARQSFTHLVYHFVLTYANWETVSICYSESFESLSEGFQKAVWKLGGVTQFHRTDRLSAAVHKDLNPEEFTKRYQGLLDHYGIQGQKTQAASPHENGDVEQRHYRFKRALDQSLMLRGSRDFATLADYQCWLDKLTDQLNSGRAQRFAEESKELKALPDSKLDALKRLRIRVSQGSTIRVAHNTYSVNSRLKGEMIDVRLYGDHLQVWYGQKKLECIPRLRGEHGHCINYRHIIDSLVRKPGAFANYRYRQDMFPTHWFRMAYDHLKEHLNGRGDKAYLQILHLAARHSEAGVDHVLKTLLEQDKPIDPGAVEELVSKQLDPPRPCHVTIAEVELERYDQLLSDTEVGR